MIHNISAGFIETYINFLGKEKLTTGEMFKRLSLEMGGDGKTITKKQLDEYIAKAESGDIKVGKKKLSALKQIQKNWDTISGGKDNITAGDMKDYSALLMATMTDAFSTTETDDSTQQNPYEVLLKSLGITDINDAKNSELKSYLNTLLSDESDDATITDTIDSIMNLMATRETNSTISADA